MNHRSKSHPWKINCSISNMIDIYKCTKEEAGYAHKSYYMTAEKRNSTRISCLFVLYNTPSITHTTIQLEKDKYLFCSSSSSLCMHYTINLSCVASLKSSIIFGLFTSQLLQFLSFAFCLLAVSHLLRS